MIAPFPVLLRDATRCSPDASPVECREGFVRGLPGLHRERGIGDGEVEPFEASRTFRETGGGERVVALDLGRHATV